MIAMVEGAKRQKTPNEIALTILLVEMTLVFLLASATLLPFSIYARRDRQAGSAGDDHRAGRAARLPDPDHHRRAALGDRARRHGPHDRANVIAMSGRAVEAAGDVDVLLLDKTGTITLGNRQADAFLPAPGVTREELADAAQLASLADETPEGRSIVVLAKQQFDMRERDLKSLGATFVPFSAHTRMSGVDLEGRQHPQGRGRRDPQAWVESQGGRVPAGSVKRWSTPSRARGSTPLVVADGTRVLGVIELKDIVKGGIKERFASCAAWASGR